MDIGKIPAIVIGAVISTVITAVLTPVIVDSISDANLSGTTLTVANQIPLFLWLTLFVAIAYGMLQFNKK